MKNKRKILLLCLVAMTWSSVHPQNRGAAARDYIHIYQKYLSGLKTSHCPMYPTCSQYGTMSFADHSFLSAMILTADRLIRCGNHAEYYQVITSSFANGQLLDYPSNRNIPKYISTELQHSIATESIIPKDSIHLAIQFTNYLINHQSYSCALLEIERLMFFDTAFKSEPSLYLNKLRCFEGLQRASDGLLFFEQEMPLPIKKNYKVIYTAAHLYGLVGDYAKSISLYLDAAKSLDSNEAHPFGELAILYAQTLKYDDARRMLKQKHAIDGNDYAFSTSNSILDKLESTKYKNKTTAMILGVFPGAGYLYTKQPKNALTSLLVNCILAYAVYSSFHTKNYGLGIILGAFSISFYGGNIVGSGISASRYNEKNKLNAINELRKINPFYY